jgi:hypothetical protein
MDNLAKNTRQEWNWYYNTNTGELIQRQGTKFGTHKATINAIKFEEIRSKILPCLPQEAVPVTAVNFRITSIPIKSDYPINTNEDTPSTFDEYVDQLDDWERNLLRTTGNIRDTAEITSQIILSDKTYMVSDGGMINGYGSYGWIIANDDEITKGRGEAEGAQHLMQSFRAEGYGMLAALRYLLHAFTYTTNWPTNNKTIHIFCDNLALIQRIGWHEKRIVTTPKDIF